MLLAQINTNLKVIEAQNKEILGLKKKDKDLEERDYLIELEERASKIMKEIHHGKKEKHHQGVVIEKLDNKLLSIQDSAHDDEFKVIKVLKHQILHYFKKFHENRETEEELDKSYDALMEKDRKLTEKYGELAKLAETRFLLVKANGALIHLKKAMDDLLGRVEAERRKRDVLLRSQGIMEEKLDKECDQVGKELDRVEDLTD